MSDKFRSYLKFTLMGIGSLFSAALVLLFFKQNRLIYHPKFPYQSPGQNSFGYRTPADRKLPFKSVEAITKDGKRLKG